MWPSKPPLGTPLDWSNPLNKGLVMHLPVNEGHGDHLNDLSMNGNHGTLKNMAFPSTAASGWNPGRAGVGLNFDGTNDYAHCEHNTSLNTTDAITISAKVSSNLLTDNKFIVAKGSVFFVRTEGNDVTVALYIGGVMKYAKSTGLNLLTAKNYNIVTTYDKCDGSNLIRLFVNGNEVTYGQHDNTGGGAIDTSDLSLYIGKRVDGYNMNGSIDQPRILNRAYTPKEVKDYTINPWQVYLDE